MNNDPKARKFTLDIQSDEDDPEQVDRMTRQLRAELEEAELGDAELAHAGSAPTGAKSAEVVTLGSLAVTVLPAVLPKLVDFLQAYVLRRMDRRIKIKTASFEMEIPPGGISEEEESKLIHLLQSSGGAPAAAAEKSPA